MTTSKPITAKTITALILTLALVSSNGCSQSTHPAGITLAQGRAGFTTHITNPKNTPDAIPDPPPDQFVLVHYAAPLGSFPAYVSVQPTATGKYPAIIWLVGGFDNSIGDTPWAPATPDNDQSARAFRQDGIITMFPSLRGGNNNSGSIECLYGEVDDVLAARKYLASLSYVNPNRIYLGGHSTGGTLALLVDESTDQFRAVFAFGPIDEIANYGNDRLPFDFNNDKELELRSPIHWLDAIKSPTFVIEGTEDPSNIGPLHAMAAESKNPSIQFAEVANRNHFSELAQSTPVVAQKVALDTGPVNNISISGTDFAVR